MVTKIKFKSTPHTEFPFPWKQAQIWEMLIHNSKNNRRDRKEEEWMGVDLQQVKLKRLLTEIEVKFPSGQTTTKA